MERGLLGVKKDIKNPVLYFVNGEEWPSDDSADKDFVAKNDSPLTKAMDDVNPVVESDSTTMTTAMISTSATTPCVGKFVIKRTSKDNGEDKFTFRRKRRSKVTFDPSGKPAKRSTKTSILKKTVKPHMELTSTSIDEAAMSPWHTALPLDVLLKIFKMVIRSEGVIPFLERASQVCELWKTAAVHPSLWTHIDVSKPKVSMTEVQLIKLSQTKFINVRELNLANWSNQLKATTIETIIEKCPLLISLNLSGCKKLSGSLLNFVIDKCPNLTSLDVSYTQSNGLAGSAVSFNSISYLASKLGNKLLHLNIGGNVVSGLRAVVTLISEGFPELRVLDMSGVMGANRDPLYMPIEKLQQGCKKLKVLRIANVDLRLTKVPLAEQASSAGFPELEELSIAKVNQNFHEWLDEPSFERILKSSSKLKLLDVRGCSRVTSSCLMRIQAWDVEHLFLSQCTNAMTSGLELVMQKWAHSLVQVDLSWNNQSGESIDLAVKALAELTPSESPLRSLDLCGSAVSLEPVKSVLGNCPKLEVLNLSSCRGLPRGIKRVYDVESLVKLRANVKAMHAE